MHAEESTGVDIPPIISLDDHVIEPPDLWRNRLPSRYRDVGPRVENLPRGKAVLEGGKFREQPGVDGRAVAYWRYEDLFMCVKRLSTAVGFPGEAVTLDGVTYDEIRPGCWQQGPRLDDMDLNGVEASLCFPNFPRFCGQTFVEAKDKDLALLCVRAYNDWMVDEWCAGSKGRLLPLCLVPLWDSQLAAAEVARNAARGVRGVAFSEVPAYLGLPSIHSGYWDAFFRQCEETGTVLFLHIGSGTKMPKTSDDAPDLVAVTIGFGNCVASMADFIFSGVLERFPDLKVVYSEGQIGWIPFFLERADDAWESTGVGPSVPTPSPNRHLPITTVRSTVASSRTSTGSSRSTALASTTSRSRATTPTPIAPGPTLRHWRRKCSPNWTIRPFKRSSVAMPWICWASQESDLAIS